MMSTEDLQRAEVVRPRIAEFVQDAHGEELAQRLAWVVLHGKTLEKLLYLELAAKRTDLLDHTRTALDQLVDPKQAQITAKATIKAEALRKKSGSVAVRASQLLNQLDGTLAAEDEKRKREYAQYLF